MALSFCNFDGTPLSVEPLMELLKGLSPASIDSEFRNMAPDAGGSVDWMEYFMEFLLDQLKTNKNYELVQSYLGLFLKVRAVLREHLCPPIPHQLTCSKLKALCQDIRVACFILTPTYSQQSPRK